MKPGLIPVRLLAEIVAIVLLVETGVMWLLPLIVPAAEGWAAWLTDALSLVVLSAPALYWRCMHATRQAAGVGTRARNPSSPMAAEHSRPQQRQRHLAIAWTAGVQIAGLAITGLIMAWAHAGIQEAAFARYERMAERIETNVRQRFVQPLHGLKGARGVYTASSEVTRREFHDFVKASDLQDEFVGVKGIGYIRRVARADLSRFVATQRADGAPDFNVRSRGDAPDLFVIQYLEPVADNAQALGFDIGAEPVRRAAAEQAMRSGEPTLTAPISLVQAPRSTAGFLLLVPVYRAAAVVDTPEQRERALQGWVYSPLIAQDLLKGVADVADHLLNAELYEGVEARPEHLVYDAATNATAVKPWFTHAKAITIAGREFTLRVSTTPAFEASIERDVPRIIGLAGALLSLLAALAVWSLAASRLRAVNLAQRMTAEQERLARVVRHTANGVSITDRDLRITWVNEGFTHITGYSAEEALGKTPGELLSSGKADPATLQALADSAAAGASCRVEILNRAKDGHEYWVDTEIQPLHDANGKLIGFMEIGADITQRKQAEASLSQAHERTQVILENLPCGLCVVDASLRMVAHNMEYRQLLDLPDAMFAEPEPDFEAILRFQVYRGDFGQGNREAMLARFVESARHPVPFHSDHLRASGLVLEIRSVPLPGGGLVVTYNNVTERKAAEAALRNADALLRGAIDTVNEAFVLYDPQDRLVFCNDKYRQIYATSADLMVPGTSFEHIVRTGAERGQYKEAVGRVDEWVAERMAAHRAGDMVLEQRLDDGRWLRVVERKMPDGHIVGFRIDITDLKSATEAAEAASRAKSSFLANVSHEIRTPMNAILGMLQLLQHTELTDRQRDYADKTERAARALLGLLNDLLDFAKAEAGKMTLEPLPFRPLPLLEDLRDMLAANLGGKPVCLEWDIDAHLPAVLVGDELRLRQVLMNLGGNAIKFTETGEVRLEVRVSACDARVCRLEFRVRDTGIGIAPEHHQHIFEGFSQAEASTTRRFGGTGLGLSICRHLVGLMGGQLALESAPGQGSCFSFTLDLPVAAEGSLPQQEPRLLETGPARGLGPPRLQGLRLLVVEDNDNNQQVARELLQGEGASVSLAGDGQQGLDAVSTAQPPFDAVLMDVQMPVMDGYTATGLIRRLPAMAGLPIIAMTANASAKDRLASLAAGMNDHVGKPFDLNTLVATLRRHVGDRGAPEGAADHGPAPAAPRRPRPARPAPVLLPADLFEHARGLGIDLANALDRMGDRIDVYLRMTGSFMNQLARWPDEWAALVAAGPADDVVRLAHTIKGLSATFGASQLATLAAQAEDALRLSPTNAATWTPRLREACSHAARGMDDLLGRMRALAAAEPSSPDGPAMPGDPAERAAHHAAVLRALLDTLTALLRDHDMAAVDAFAALKASHGPDAPDALIALGETLTRLDFAAALIQCNILARTWTV